MANGSERAVDDIIEHTFQISVCMWLEDISLSKFLQAVLSIHFSCVTIYTCVCIFTTERVYIL